MSRRPHRRSLIERTRITNAPPREQWRRAKIEWWGEKLYWRKRLHDVTDPAYHIDNAKDAVEREAKRLRRKVSPKHQARRVGRKLTAPLRRGKYSVRRLYRVGRDTARAVGTAQRDGLGTPRAELRGLTPVEHLALPAAYLAIDVMDDVHEHRGNWVLDDGRSRWAFRFDRFHSWTEALEAAWQLRHRDADVWIRWREHDGPGVQPFVDPHTVADRLEELERVKRDDARRERGRRESGDALRRQRKEAGV